MTSETQLFSFQSIIVNWCQRRPQSVRPARHCCAQQKNTHDKNNKCDCCMFRVVVSRRFKHDRGGSTCLCLKKREIKEKKKNLMFPTGGFSWLQFCSLVSEASSRREPQRKNLHAADGWTNEQRDTHLAAASGKKQSAAYWLAAVCDFINRGRPREVRRFSAVQHILPLDQAPPAGLLGLHWNAVHFLWILSKFEASNQHFVIKMEIKF